MRTASHATWCLAAFLIAALPAGAGDALTPVDETGFGKVLASHRGKVVLANFWATWCEPCRHEMPLLVALEKKWRGRGFVLLTVSADEPEQEAEALSFLRKAAVRPPAYIKRAGNDEAFIDSVDKSWSGALPALFLYGRDGRKVASFIGETKLSDIETALGNLL
ncbi:MAG TPA: TlpA disulfide reductase family protein [Bryobacteraceae bacterium]|nr:TlpA disulfide reductase family protein [Bryobacteraceae bacterium]